MDWKEIDQKAITQAKSFRIAQSALLDTLQIIDKEKIYRKTGHSSLWDYCIRRLKLAEYDTEAFIRVARKAVTIPELKQAIQSGEINLSAAKKVCSVITKENQKDWIEKAKTLPQRELELEIVRENPRETVKDKLKPLASELTELHCTISTEVEEMIKKVQNIESKRQRKNVSLEEAFKQMAHLYLEKKDPVRKAVKIESRKEKIGTFNQTNLVNINYRFSKQLKLDSKFDLSRIPKMVLNNVNFRDKGRCIYKDSAGEPCHVSRFTEIHHIKPRSLGGKDELDNLATLCSTHHKSIHEGVGGFRLDM